MCVAIRLFLLLQKFEAMWEDKVGDAWLNWKSSAKTSSAYMDFMGKAWDGIKIVYSVKDSEKLDPHYCELEIPTSLGKLLDEDTLQ